ncbi:Hypothetical protein FKW44_008155 [Caligus rogercresseyi]|uniref:Uncharacterized protein n=1 Tax=Caligus rogercresseyi TaxID=217165 RepID=A0A7T8KFR2_CALRO|nr:Hypothetical protein FKW44_008155 [Caligus rogercresseyi]
MKAQRNRIAALLEANLLVSVIVNKEGCSRCLVYKVKALLSRGEGLERNT